MSGYVDLQQEALDALEQRRYRRRRIISGIRGRLQQSHAPRRVAATLLLASLLPAAIVAVLAAWGGLSWFGPAPALGILVQWPAFVWLVHWRCERWTHRENAVQKVEDAIPFDEATQAQENRGLYSEDDSQLHQSIQSGLRSGLQSGGGGGLPVLLILGLLTLGTLLIWDLLRISPTLFAETIFDGPVARQIPRLEERVELQNWRSNAFVGTGIYFFGLALVAILLGAMAFTLRRVV